MVCAGHQVAGYYALAVGAVAHAHAPGRVRRNMPDPVPVMVVGRLAVHKTIQGKKIGRGLLADLMLTRIAGLDITASSRFLVHADFRAGATVL